MLDRRLIVLDDQRNVIAYSIHATAVDRHRLSVVMTHSDTWPPLRPATGVATRTVEGLGTVLSVALEDPRRVVGEVLVVLGDDPDLSAADLARLQEGAGRLGPLVSLRTLYAEHDRLHARRLLADLVGPDATARVSAARGLVDDGLIGPSGRYCAVAIGASSAAGHRQEQAALAVEATIGYVGRTSTATVVGATLADGLGILVFPRPVEVDRLAVILARLEPGGAIAGVGPVVPALDQVWLGFRRARAALSVAVIDRNSPVRTWDELGVDRLLVQLPLQDLTLDDLPVGLSVLLADPSAGLLVPTLAEYLAAGGDAQATARRLSIHRSTLYYRLDKLRSVTGCDLGDGLVRRDLHTGLRVAQLAGLWPGPLLHDRASSDRRSRVHPRGGATSGL